MLDQLIPKLRFQLAKAAKILPEDGVAAVEKVYNDILLMRNFIVNEYQRSERDKNNSRREVLEKAITKLEILKSKRSASDLIKELEAKLSEEPAKGDDRILKFLQEREIRDRLAAMPPSACSDAAISDTISF
jgi:spore cortex formation protein SpoVR/YcgB (stage V sporulation)